MTLLLLWREYDQQVPQANCKRLIMFHWDLMVKSKVTLIFRQCKWYLCVLSSFVEVGKGLTLLSKQWIFAGHLVYVGFLQSNFKKKIKILFFPCRLSLLSVNINVHIWKESFALLRYRTATVPLSFKERFSHISVHFGRLFPTKAKQ